MQNRPANPGCIVVFASIPKEMAMNSDQIEGKWKQFAGKAKEKWGKLTDDDLQVIRGKRDQLVGRVQERYGIAKEEAQKQVDEFNRVLGPEIVVVETDGEEATSARKAEKAHGAGKR
jgi:uncharacterized protein YjbJ (UPF0337 family)